MNNRRMIYLTASLSLALLTGILLVLANFLERPDMTQIIVLISGMTSMAALTSFQRFTGMRSDIYTVNLTFNETLLSRTISEAFLPIEKSSNIPHRPKHNDFFSGDLSATQLVGRDNSLALARLRIDIESELRRIALNVEVDPSTHPIAVIGLARELMFRGVLPEISLEPLQKLIDVCNKAIHGGTVSNETATTVVRVGSQLLERLRLLPITTSNLNM